MSVLPPDPFGDEDEVLMVGRLVLEAVTAATGDGGLMGLYVAVLALDRDDLEAAAFVAVTELLTGVLSADVERVWERSEERELSEGERLLSRATMRVWRGGLPAVREGVRALSVRQLRRMLIDPREVALVEARERFIDGGEDES